MKIQRHALKKKQLPQYQFNWDKVNKPVKSFRDIMNERESKVKENNSPEGGKYKWVDYREFAKQPRRKYGPKYS